MQLVDTHCHIHESSYQLNSDEVLTRAREAGVTRVICVGTDQCSSVEAIDFAKKHDNVWAIVGVHPHETKDGLGEVPDLLSKNHNDAKLVGIGEIGLDYYYDHSPRDVQIEMLNQQIELALKYNLPISFHVRNAFDDFWSIFDNFHNLNGVVHSFTDSIVNMEKALERGLYIGVNGIATFCHDQNQCGMYSRIPLERMLLETDAPFLTPSPNRGKVNEPAYVRDTAWYLGELRDQPIERIAEITTLNAKTLFGLK